jgi:pyruvate/2-oxoglutarate dehydrogenase complex dihydrolipoamide acyltransferase (E2) component
MKTAILIPKLSQTMEEATVTEILVSNGDFVKAGQAVINISADKADASVSPEKDGYIQIVCAVDDEIEVGKPIAYVADTKEELDL